MRVTIAMPSTGLFYAPGLAEPVVLELSALPPEEAARIQALVHDAKFLDRTAAPEALTRPMPDARQFTVTVEQAGRSRTLHLAEPIADPALKALVGCLLEQVRALREKKRQ
ncbi:MULTISPECIES: protealysin inhibitor emfourin [unclassified Inquilinus]|uniref:protealysin inhibitor emfourin n=1 Tax=unclassified Inquilinus TaxID=2645927 RepID=UPI003F8EF1EF